ncbi:MAG: LysM domain-containing protein [Anaerolineae bacterium]
MKTRLTLLTLFIGALMVVACNLALPDPTPTPMPTQPRVATPIPGIPSITPLGGSGQPISVTGDNGQVCVIPSGWIEYTVEAGDSLSLLAEQTGSTVDQLVSTNCMTNADNLFEGQTLYLPRIPVVGS